MTSGEKRHGHEEDHDRAVGGEELAEVLGRQETAVQPHALLGTHEDRFDDRSGEHDEGDHDEHDADLLVIHTGQPVAP